MPSDDTTPSDTDDRDASTTSMRTVDLTPDDALADPGQGPDTQTAAGTDAETAPDGERVAKQALQAADGATEREHLDAAIADLRDEFDTLAQRRSQTQRRQQRLAQQREQFKATRDHLQSLVDDGDERLIMREWAGGISTAVPPEDLPDLVETVDERRESLRDDEQQIAERLDTISHRIETVQAGLSELQTRKEAFETVESTKQDINGSLSQTESQDRSQPTQTEGYRHPRSQ